MNKDSSSRDKRAEARAITDVALEIYDMASHELVGVARLRSLSVSGASVETTSELVGRDYLFVSAEEFDALLGANGLLEWAEVHGNRYGTTIATVDQAIGNGTDCLFDVDFQGGRQIRKLWPADSVLCFISQRIV